MAQTAQNSQLPLPHYTLSILIASSTEVIVQYFETYIMSGFDYPQITLRGGDIDTVILLTEAALTQKDNGINLTPALLHELADEAVRKLKHRYRD